MGSVVADQVTDKTALRGADPLALDEAQQQEVWVEKHINKIKDSQYLPIAAILASLLMPVFCIACMKGAKQEKGAPPPCGGWGPCIFFGGMVTVFFVYTALLGYGVLPAFHAD